MERALDMRYQGQSFELMVRLDDEASDGPTPAAAFEALHEQQYGHRNAGTPIQAVNLRLRAVGSAEKPAGRAMAEASGPALPPVTGHTAIWNGRRYDAPVLDRAELTSGLPLTGPAIITEYSSTIVIPPDATAQADEQGNLFITLGG